MRTILLNQSFQFISADAGDTCANYAKLLPDNQVEVETLHRYGKPHSRIISKSRFDDLMRKDLI